ncbi:KH domain-containing protein [Bacillus suaedaesalsae]|uniref:RNA-binding protein KhpA n=1 Tax=Bacillus suaedaesalsae TaxID=2810349 RepID=A0ABS2DJ04_9BACI|nr:KH domain-containing protein [Bacillus suaedaesalsae]MBM6618471.1 KH domain-containing protein [Bacillus suaedaesalsae]
MKDLIETIVKPLVDYPDDVVITEVEDNNHISYKLSVHKEDVGKIIGKNGRVAKAIRTVIYAAATKSEKRIQLDIQ